MAISFQFNQIFKPSFFRVTKIKPWLNAIAQNENRIISNLSYIFMNDEDLRKINIEYLNHDTYTDIITFDTLEDFDIPTDRLSKFKIAIYKAKAIEGDIFISLERVEENAKKFNTTFENELLRVMAHGLLHLCGYKDKKKADIEMMRKKEEESLMMLL